MTGKVIEINSQCSTSVLRSVTVNVPAQHQQNQLFVCELISGVWHEWMLWDSGQTGSTQRWHFSSGEMWFRWLSQWEFSGGQLIPAHHISVCGFNTSLTHANIDSLSTEPGSLVLFYIFWSRKHALCKQNTNVLKFWYSLITMIISSGQSICVFFCFFFWLIPNCRAGCSM